MQKCPFGTLRHPPVAQQLGLPSGGGPQCRCPEQIGRKAGVVVHSREERLERPRLLLLCFRVREVQVLTGVEKKRE